MYLCPATRTHWRDFLMQAKPMSPEQGKLLRKILGEIDLDPELLHSILGSIVTGTQFQDDTLPAFILAKLLKRLRNYQKLRPYQMNGANSRLGAGVCTDSTPNDIFQQFRIVIPTDKQVNRFKVITRVLGFSTRFEYGYQPKKGIFAVRYTDMFTLDFDGSNIPEIVENIRFLADKYGVRFRYYRTHRGVHAFLTSHMLPYYSCLAKQIYQDSIADEVYSQFCNYNGYLLRVSPKSGDTGATREYLGEIGSAPDAVTMLRLVQCIESCTSYHDTHPRAPGVPVNRLFRPLPGAESGSFYAWFVHEVTNVAALKEADCLRFPEFRNYILSTSGKTVAVVEQFRQYFHSIVARPQALLLDHSDYFFAMDISTKCFYMNLKSVLMVDIDLEPGEDPLERLHDLDTQLIDAGICAMAYKTRRGLHLFLVDRPRYHLAPDSIQIALDLGSDFYYTVYSTIRCWSVRISPKDDEEPLAPLYSYLGVYGRPEGAVVELARQVQLHFEYSCDRVHLKRLIGML